MLGVAVCCSVLQCIAVCCSVLRVKCRFGRAADFCDSSKSNCESSHTATHCNTLHRTATLGLCRALALAKQLKTCVAVCCSAAACCCSFSVLQCVTIQIVFGRVAEISACSRTAAQDECCSMLQCYFELLFVAMCCSKLQCVTVYYSVL